MNAFIAFYVPAYIPTYKRHEKIAHTYRFQSMSVGQGRQCIVFFLNKICVCDMP